MRIAFVLDAIYPYNKGGKEKRAFEISTRLAARGHDVHVFCMKWWKGPERERLENGVWLHAISGYHPLYTDSRKSIQQGLLFGLACLRLIGGDFDVLDVDHIPYFPLIATKIVSVLKRRPLTATWHEVWGRDYWIAYLGWKGLVAHAL